MSEILTVLIVFSVICILPFIIAFFVAMFCVKEMPNEERRPASIKDCFECIFFDGYTDTQYDEYYNFFVIARCPFLGFFAIVCFIIAGSIWFLFCGLFKLISYIPGVKQFYNYIGNTYNKIINYKFR
jgi:hypothetical protein